MIQIFLKGGPIMWPLLLVSIITLAVVFERIWFSLLEQSKREPVTVSRMIAEVEQGHLDKAMLTGTNSLDFVARSLAYALQHRNQSFTDAMLRAANQELDRFTRGISTLDTVITLAPLLGLLGTVTGMIRAFGLLGMTELSAPTAITGGIAEALMATAFGLSIAIVALIPFNYLNARLERARHEIQDAASHVELLLLKLQVPQ
jgi:biopolymer transport protein ExbB